MVGLSKFHKLSDVLGLDTTKLNAIVETLDCLHLLAHRVLTHANEELGQFAAFSRWLRHEIHVLNSEPLSQTLEELQEKRDLFDVPPTVKYIKGALTKSALRNFIRQLPMIGVVQPPAPPADKWLPGEHDRSFFDTFKSLLQQQRESRDKGGDGTSVETPKLNDLTRRLGIQFEKVFGDIALTQRRGILHRSPLTLHSDCDQGVIDLTFCYEVSLRLLNFVLFQMLTSTTGCHGRPALLNIRRYPIRHIKTSRLVVQSLFRLQLLIPSQLVYLYRVVLNSVGGVSSTSSTSLATLDLQNGEVRQLQFVKDDTLMVLWRDSSKSPAHLLMIFLF